MKPAWLNKKISLKDCSTMKQSLRDLHLETVCEQAMCPNIGECFLRKVATFLILGKNCTRSCSFCNVTKAKPYPVDDREPERVAQAVAQLGLKHVVITSVTRDDLADGGAGIFADTVRQINRKLPSVTVELLIPDFGLSLTALETVVRSAPEIIAHNLETIPSLYKTVRQGADYSRSLKLLRLIKDMAPKLRTKSGLMLGLGEKPDEILAVMKDLRSARCDLLSIGQYLSPSKKHYPVKDYILPEQFDYYKEKGRELGFLHVQSAPYVRSSYLADQYLS
ncbi:MAG TPA: lipoyl synthase [Candidatus Omnitrophota bacterium]|nr:lipoyl synthase [Candidatus Omnitrophota bacterium]HPT39670.1 lipoyl synthase [Candidatus Omnitrophota bacterium]